MSLATIIRDDAGTPRTVTAIQVRDGDNMARDISEVRVRDGNNVSRIVFTVAGPLSASADPTVVYGVSTGSGTATSNSTHVTASGGVAPYTYAWTLLLHDGVAVPTVSDDTADTVTVTQTSIPHDDTISSQWQCTVTDDDGNNASTEIDAVFFGM